MAEIKVALWHDREGGGPQQTERFENQCFQLLLSFPRFWPKVKKMLESIADSLFRELDLAQ